MSLDLTNISDDTSHKLWEGILNSVTYGVMGFKTIRNDNGDIIDFELILVNKEAEKILGKRSSDMIGKGLSNLIKGGFANQELFDKSTKVVLTGKPASIEHKYKEKSFNKWLKISAVKFGDGFTLTLQNISELRNYNQMLRQTVEELDYNERKYRVLFEESIDSICVTDNDYMISEANQAFYDQFGIKHKSKPFRLSRLFVKPEDFDELCLTLEQDRQVEEFEIKMKGRKGPVIDCLINVVRITDLETNHYSHFCVIRNITKRKKAERDIIMAEKLQMTGKIARSIAHEIRNPLTNLSLALEQLKDELPQDINEGQFYFDIIKRNSHRIGKLITELLNSSKPKELKLKDHSINKVIKETIELARDRMSLRHMKLEESYDDKIPLLKLDKSQIKIAFLNIFLNAIEAMKPKKGRLEVTTSLSNDEVIITVEDNGKGISDEDLNKLFEPFFTGEKEGMGLGLTTTQNIIHSHKGIIEVESELGKGTQFNIIFPLNIR